MSSDVLLNAMIVVTIFGAVVFLAVDISNQIAEDIEKADFEEADREVTSPEYKYPLLDVVFVVLVISTILSVISVLHRPQPTNSKKVDPVDRYKEQYVEGDLTLEEFEDRVYRVVEVEVE